MKTWRCFAFATAALMVSPAAVFCNQQDKRPVPSMTSDDVVAARPVRPAESASAAETKAGGQAKGSEAGGKPNPDELAWREAVRKARSRAEAAQRAAEETEIRVTDLRNQLSSSGQTAGDRNQTMSDLNAIGETLKQRKAEARDAAEELNKLIDQGREKNYKEDSGPSPTSKNGEPNEDYYRAKFGELTQALQDADRRVQLYQNRVNELSQRITGNSRSGDNFYISQLQQDRDEAQRSLDQARGAYQKAQADIDALKEQARAANVAPGVFR